eukprot:UN00515
MMPFIFEKKITKLFYHCLQIISLQKSFGNFHIQILEPGMPRVIFIYTRMTGFAKK